MTDLMHDAAWTLVVAFALSLAYEAWRATAKAGTSRHDSRRAFVMQLPIYAVAAAVAALLFAGFAWAAWAGLVFSVGMIVVSIFYDNPVIMLERAPGIVDWVEDLVFTGLLFVAKLRRGRTRLVARDSHGAAQHVGRDAVRVAGVRGGGVGGLVGAPGGLRTGARPHIALARFDRVNS